MLMEHLPHLVIEGVILSAYAIGASKAYLYMNANYGTAIRSMTDALDEAKNAGYWGEAVLGSSFKVDIEITPLLTTMSPARIPRLSKSSKGKNLGRGRSLRFRLRSDSSA